MRIAQSVEEIQHLLGVFLVLTMVVAAPVSTASAQESPDTEKAEAYYQQGVNAFFNKKYSLAITYFKRANALDPDPVVLYNISLAQSRLGNAQEALDAAREAQQMGGMPEDTAQKNRARIRAYQRVLTARAVGDALVPQAPAGAQAARAAAPSAGLAGPADSGMSALGWTGIGTATVGAAALIGAGVLTLMVGNDLDEYDNARADGDFGRARALQKDINDGQSLGQIMLYSGAGLLAVGGALWAVDYFGATESKIARDSSDEAAVFGAVSAEAASVQVRWRF